MNTRIPVDDRAGLFKTLYREAVSPGLSGAMTENTYEKIGKVFLIQQEYSDEYCKYGEFTGAMVGTDLRRPRAAQAIMR